MIDIALNFVKNVLKFILLSLLGKFQFHFYHFTFQGLQTFIGQFAILVCSFKVSLNILNFKRKNVLKATQFKYKVDKFLKILWLSQIIWTVHLLINHNKIFTIILSRMSKISVGAPCKRKSNVILMYMVMNVIIWEFVLCIWLIDGRMGAFVKKLKL